MCSEEMQRRCSGGQWRETTEKRKRHLGRSLAWCRLATAIEVVLCIAALHWGSKEAEESERRNTWWPQLCLQGLQSWRLVDCCNQRHQLLQLDPGCCEGPDMAEWLGIPILTWNQLDFRCLNASYCSLWPK
nr:uncharacterized protein LOC119162405 isoform X1 [Rhipicephalus microplus]